MRNFLSFVFVLILVTLSVLFVNCGLGTETGNPTTGAQEEGDTASMEEVSGILDGDVEVADEASDDTADTADVALPDVSGFLSALCRALDDCFSNVNATDCEEDLNTDKNALAEFGADTDVYSSFDEVQADVDLGELKVSFNEFNSCTDAIEALTCQEIEEAGAFDESNPSVFSNVHKMIPEDC